MSFLPAIHECSSCGTVVSAPGLCAKCVAERDAEERPTRPMPRMKEEQGMSEKDGKQRPDPERPGGPLGPDPWQG